MNESSQLDTQPTPLDPGEFDAGYTARIGEEPLALTATTSWQAGWADANRELTIYRNVAA